MLTPGITLDQDTHGTLQSRLREKLSEAILRGDFEDGIALPSTRKLSKALRISRNTVTLVYLDLVAEGVLIAEGRRGFFVAPDAVSRLLPQPLRADQDSTVEWDSKLALHPSEYRSISQPHDWRTKKYTFIYGQHDRWLFPLSNWRKVSRDSLSLHDMHDWTVDYVDGDDPLLLDAFRRLVLPRRGFTATQEQILVTVDALQLAAQCLIRPGMIVGVEDPCYPDARNIFRMYGAVLKPLPVDAEGLIVTDALDACDVGYVTPSHQSPTTVTLSAARSAALLQRARRNDFRIIEDDYDTESRFGKRVDQASQSTFTLRQARLTTSLLTAPSNRPKSARLTRRVLVPAR